MRYLTLNHGRTPEAKKAGLEKLRTYVLTSKNGTLIGFCSTPSLFPRLIFQENKLLFRMGQTTDVHKLLRGVIYSAGQHPGVYPVSRFGAMCITFPHRRSTYALVTSLLASNGQSRHKRVTFEPRYIYQVAEEKCIHWLRQRVKCFKTSLS